MNPRIQPPAPVTTAGSTHRALFERAAGHASRFRDGLGERPPWPTIAPADLEALFDGPTPEAGEHPEMVIDALANAADPGLTASPGPRFFGWVIGASEAVGVAAEILTSAWGQNAATYATAPAAAMAEKVAARWLLDMLRLPPECSVGFVTGATMASFVCLAAARNALLRRLGWDVEADGMAGAPRIRIFIGQDAHVTIVAALRYLGFGSGATRIATDGQGRMIPEALAAALTADESPAIVIAQAGQINTGAIDPMPKLAELCRRHGAWLHVDGAFGLWARAVPEMDELSAGLDEADSWSTDGHKWLQLPYDSGFAIVRDAGAHSRAMAMSASYLQAAEGAEYDPGQYAPELSRRARGFAAWAALRAFGRRGVAEMVRHHCELARRLASGLAVEPGVTVLNDVVLNQVVVNFGDGAPEARDLLTRTVVDNLQRDNICLAGGADWRGRKVLRLSVISAHLTEADIDRLIDAILQVWRPLRDERHSLP